MNKLIAVVTMSAMPVVVFAQAFTTFSWGIFYAEAMPKD